MPSPELVVDDDQLIALAQLGQQGGQGPGELLAAVPGDDEDGERRAHRRGGYSAFRAGARYVLVVPPYFFLPQVLMCSPYLLFLTFLPF